LAAHLRDNATVLQLVPPMLPAFVTSPEEYAATWVAELRAAGVTVIAILSFCAGAAFAPELARDLPGPNGLRPTVFLFEPVTIDASVLLEEYEEAVQDLPAAPTIGSTDDLAILGARLAATYQSQLRAALPPAAASAADGVAAWFRGYLQFLVAAAGASGIGDGEAGAPRFGDGEPFYAVLTADRPLPGAVEVLHSTEPRDRLLGDPAAARFVEAHLP